VFRFLGQMFNGMAVGGHGDRSRWKSSVDHLRLKKRRAAGGGAGRSGAWGDGGATHPGSTPPPGGTGAALGPEHVAILPPAMIPVDRPGGSNRCSTKVLHGVFAAPAPAQHAIRRSPVDPRLEPFFWPSLSVRLGLRLILGNCGHDSRYPGVVQRLVQIGEIDVHQFLYRGHRLRK
jgi:hypothetical protein